MNLLGNLLTYWDHQPKLCIRTGNPTGIDPTLPIPFSRAIDILWKREL